MLEELSHPLVHLMILTLVSLNSLAIRQISTMKLLMLIFLPTPSMLVLLMMCVEPTEEAVRALPTIPMASLTMMLAIFSTVTLILTNSTTPTTITATPITATTTITATATATPTVITPTVTTTTTTIITTTTTTTVLTLTTASPTTI